MSSLCSGGKKGIVNIVTRPGRPWYAHRRKIRRAVEDYNLSKCFGWTPEQIRCMSREERLTYLAMIDGDTFGRT